MAQFPALLGINIAARATYVKKWFGRSKVIYSGWSNTLPNVILKYKPEALIWFVDDKALAEGMMFRHVSTIRTAFPVLPILLICKSAEMDQDQFIDGCKCSVIDIEGLEPDEIGKEMQLSLNIAHHLVSGDHT